MRDGPWARRLSSAWLPLRCLPRAGFWNAMPGLSEGPGDGGSLTAARGELRTTHPCPALQLGPWRWWAWPLPSADLAPTLCAFLSAFQRPDSLIGTAVCLISHSARAHPQIKQALPWTLAPASFLSLQLRGRARSSRPLGEE